MPVMAAALTSYSQKVSTVRVSCRLTLDPDATESDTGRTHRRVHTRAEYLNLRAARREAILCDYPPFRHRLRSLQK